jgi:hypothetical protein
LVQRQGTASQFLQALADEARRRATVGRRASQVGTAANALAGGMAPYVIRREVEGRRVTPRHHGTRTSEVFHNNRLEGELKLFPGMLHVAGGTWAVSLGTRVAPAH